MYFGLAGQPHLPDLPSMCFEQLGAAGKIVRFVCGDGGEVLPVRGDAVALECPLLDQHLALAAGGILGANGFDVHAKFARRRSQADAVFDVPASARKAAG